MQFGILISFFEIKSTSATVNKWTSEQLTINDANTSFIFSIFREADINYVEFELEDYYGNISIGTIEL